MCKFFSCVSDGKGKVLYADWKLREKIIAGKLSFTPDSHSEILAHFGINGIMADRWNKYEYNPLTKQFTIDGLCVDDDSKKVKIFCERLDFKTVVPQLILKPIIRPFKDIKCKRITKKDLENLKKWDSVSDSVRASVGSSVGGSVWDSVWGSVWASVSDSVWDSVWGSVWASVSDSVGGYNSSFFNLDKWKYVEHKKGDNPYQSGIDLWERGIVPSYDGKVWRLYTHKGVVKTITKNKLKKVGKGE